MQFRINPFYFLFMFFARWLNNYLFKRCKSVLFFVNLLTGKDQLSVHWTLCFCCWIHDIASLFPSLTVKCRHVAEFWPLECGAAVIGTASLPTIIFPGEGGVDVPYIVLVLFFLSFFFCKLANVLLKKVEQWCKRNQSHWITFCWRITCQTETSILSFMWTRNTFLLCEAIETLEFVTAANITLINIYYKIQCPYDR